MTAVEIVLFSAITKCSTFTLVPVRLGPRDHTREDLRFFVSLGRYRGTN
jgi:hypothetical protein